MTSEQPEALRLAQALSDRKDVYEEAAAKQMQELTMRFKCTVVDDYHPNGVPLKQ